MRTMSNILKTPYLVLREQSYNPWRSSEQLAYDNPLAREVAQPLFDIDVKLAAITCRQNFGIDKKKPAYHMVNHRITLLLQGEMSVNVGKITHSLKPGEIAYCPPGETFKLLGKKGEVCSWLYFNISDSKKWQALKRNGPFVNVYDSADHMYLLLRKILDAHKYREQYSKAKALGESHMLCTLLNRFRSNLNTKDKQSKSIQGLVDKIRNNPSGNWNHQLMAKSLSVSPSTLLRLFQKNYDCPPMTLVIRERLSLAMELLSHTDQPIASIAQSCGYESAFSFMRLFRKHIGMTAGEYRDRNQNFEIE